ncbi:hypothetical protein U1Q18_039952 [Sarracenia purpurea var. burkii]
MTRPTRFLGSSSSSSSTPSSSSSAAATVAEPPEAVAVESDFVLILAALLCALICVVGLIAVARCTWLRRGASGNGGGSAAPNKGLKKKILQSLPKFTYDSAANAKLGGTDCAICLAEYADGDEIRVLPQCGHGFHVACIDTWLGSHSSCPSCRQILVVTRCRTCGEYPAVSCDGGGGGGGRTEAELKSREEAGSSSGFLPF